jgi:hypothetical protein
MGNINTKENKGGKTCIRNQYWVKYHFWTERLGKNVVFGTAICTTGFYNKVDTFYLQLTELLIVRPLPMYGTVNNF